MYYTPGWGSVITAAVGTVGVVGTLTGAWLGQHTTRQVAADNRRHEHENQVSEAAIELVEQLNAELILLRKRILRVMQGDTEIDALEAHNDSHTLIERQSAKAILKMELFAPEELREPLNSLVAEHVIYTIKASDYIHDATYKAIGLDELVNPNIETPDRRNTHGEHEIRFLDAVKNYRLTTVFNSAPRTGIIKPRNHLSSHAKDSNRKRHSTTHTRNRT